MNHPGRQKQLRTQTRKTLRNALNQAYPVELAPNAHYDRRDFTELALLAIGRGTSLHDASTALRDDGNHRLPHADTFHHHVHALRQDAWAVHRAFERTLDGILGPARDLGWLTPCEVAIDRHNENYYGAKDPWVMGQKRRAGTNWCHAYLTSIRLAEPDLWLDMQPVYPMHGRTTALKDLVEQTTRRQEVTTWYADREFHNFEDLCVFHATGSDFVIPVPRNRLPKGSIDEAWRAKRRVGARYVATRPHTLRKGKRTLDLVLVYHWEPDEEEDSGWRLFVYATPRGGTPEQLVAWADRYRARWGIETEYRVTEEDRLRTTTDVYSNRLLLTCLGILFDAYWRILRWAQTLREPEARELTNRALRGMLAREIQETVAG